MELHQLSAEEIRGFDAGKMRETEGEIRQELVKIRMDIYTAKNQHTGKIRGLKKSLARLLTIKTATALKTVKPKAPASAKATAGKPAKAAAPKVAKAPKAEAKAPKAEKAAKAPKTEAKAKTSTKKK